MKHYISDVIGAGDGEDNPFRPAVADLVTCGWGAMDGRIDGTVGGPSMLVNCDPLPAEHAILMADVRIEYIGET